MEKDFLPHLKRIIENPHNEQGVLMEQVRKILLEYDIIERNDYTSKKVSDVFKDYSKKHAADKSSQFIQTGLSQYDEKVGGLIPGEFVVIGARPAMGKTHLIINMAVNISKDHPVLYYSLEISEMMLTSRIAAAITKIPTSIILSAELNEQQEASMLKLSDEIEKLQLYIYERNSNSMTGFKAMCREHVKDRGIKVVFVDYLQLLNSSRYRNNRELEIGYISRELKNIARELNICVVATSQLSRSVEQRGGDKRPILSDLRESGSIEQDADKVFFLYRPEYYGLLEDEEGNRTQYLSELILAKNRNGALTTIRLKHDPYFTSFVPLDEQPDSFSIPKNRMDQIEPDKNSEPESECEFPF